jgi:flagellar basal-body rod protein FlgF
MMTYGLHLSASGALTSLYQMDVMSNNLANISTVGFKPELAMARQREAVRGEDGLSTAPGAAAKMLERLGGGVMSAPNRVSFQQGPLQSTGNPLDVAIEGDGFFVIRDVAAAEGDRFVLTRDGRFTLDPQGRLISSTTGMPVMDQRNRPITLTAQGNVVIAPDGRIMQNGEAVAQLSVVSLDDTSRVRRGAPGTFIAPGDVMERRRPATGAIKQYAVEGAAVDPIRAMMSVTDAGRAAEANMGMMQSHDRLMDRAINGLGRVQA